MLGTLYFSNTESTIPGAQRYARYIKTAYEPQAPKEIDEDFTNAALEMTMSYFQNEFKSDNINSMQTYLSGPFKFMYWIPVSIEHHDPPIDAIQVELKGDKLHFKSRHAYRIMNPNYREEYSADYYSAGSVTINFEERKVSTVYMRFEQPGGPNQVTIERTGAGPIVITLTIYSDSKKEMYECKHSLEQSVFAVKLATSGESLLDPQQLMRDKLEASKIPLPCDLNNPNATRKYVDDIVASAAEKTKDYPEMDMPTN